MIERSDWKRAKAALETLSSILAVEREHREGRNEWIESIDAMQTRHDERVRELVGLLIHQSLRLHNFSPADCSLCEAAHKATAS